MITSVILIQYRHTNTWKLVFVYTYFLLKKDLKIAVLRYTKSVIIFPIFLKRHEELSEGAILLHVHHDLDHRPNAPTPTAAQHIIKIITARKQVSFTHFRNLLPLLLFIYVKNMSTKSKFSPLYVTAAEGVFCWDFAGTNWRKISSLYEVLKLVEETAFSSP